MCFLISNTVSSCWVWWIIENKGGKTFSSTFLIWLHYINIHHLSDTLSKAASKWVTVWARADRGKRLTDIKCSCGSDSKSPWHKCQTQEGSFGGERQRSLLAEYFLSVKEPLKDSSLFKPKLSMRIKSFDIPTENFSCQKLWIRAIMDVFKANVGQACPIEFLYFCHQQV